MPLAMPICLSEPEWVMPVAMSGRYWIDSGRRERGGEAGVGGLAAPFSTPSVLLPSSRRSTLTVRALATFLRTVAEACSPQRFREENAVVRFISRS